MERIAIAGIFIVLFVILWQDYKYRHIHVVLPAALFSLSLWAVWEHTANFLYIAYNAVFFALVFLILIVYMSVRAKSFSNPFRNYFGLGDLLFFLSVTPLFILNKYQLFFIGSLFFSVILQKLLQKRMQEESVPLAGFSSLFLSILIIKDLFLPFVKITLLDL